MTAAIPPKRWVRCFGATTSTGPTRRRWQRQCGCCWMQEQTRTRPAAWSRHAAEGACQPALQAPLPCAALRAARLSRAAAQTNGELVTPLGLAVRHCNAGAVEALLQRGAVPSQVMLYSALMACNLSTGHSRAADRDRIFGIQAIEPQRNMMKDAHAILAQLLAAQASALDLQAPLPSDDMELLRPAPAVTQRARVTVHTPLVAAITASRPLRPASRTAAAALREPQRRGVPPPRAEATPADCPG